MKTSAKFIRIEHDQSIKNENYPNLYFELQQAVLLSLRDMGKLTQIQYNRAFEILKRQKNMPHNNGGDP